jgi:hypothetical protein
MAIDMQHRASGLETQVNQRREATKTGRPGRQHLPNRARSVWRHARPANSLSVCVTFLAFVESIVNGLDKFLVII